MLLALEEWEAPKIGKWRGSCCASRLKVLGGVACQLENLGGEVLCKGGDFRKNLSLNSRLLTFSAADPKLRSPTDYSHGKASYESCLAPGRRPRHFSSFRSWLSNRLSRNVRTENGGAVHCRSGTDTPVGRRALLRRGRADL